MISHSCSDQVVMWGKRVTIFILISLLAVACEQESSSRSTTTTTDGKGNLGADGKRSKNDGSTGDGTEKSPVDITATYLGKFDLYCQTNAITDAVNKLLHKCKVLKEDGSQFNGAVDSITEVQAFRADDIEVTVNELNISLTNISQRFQFATTEGIERVKAKITIPGRDPTQAGGPTSGGEGEWTVFVSSTEVMGFYEEMYNTCISETENILGYTPPNTEPLVGRDKSIAQILGTREITNVLDMPVFTLDQSGQYAAIQERLRRADGTMPLLGTSWWTGFDSNQDVDPSSNCNNWDYNYSTFVGFTGLSSPISYIFGEPSGNSGEFVSRDCTIPQHVLCLVPKNSEDGSDGGSPGGGGESSWFVYPSTQPVAGRWADMMMACAVDADTRWDVSGTITVIAGKDQSLKDILASNLHTNLNSQPVFLTNVETGKTKGNAQLTFIDDSPADGFTIWMGFDSDQNFSPTNNCSGFSDSGVASSPTGYYGTIDTMGDYWFGTPDEEFGAFKSTDCTAVTHRALCAFQLD